jgi:hypothetical protein
MRKPRKVTLDANGNKWSWTADRIHKVINWLAIPQNLDKWVNTTKVAAAATCMEDTGLFLDG